MKKKKIILSGLLGISVLAAGITLASCSVIPLTPYEPTTTAPSTPASSSSSEAPAASSSNVTPAVSSSDTPAPSSSSEAPVASSSEAPAVSNEVSFDATKLTTGDTYVADTTEDTTEEKAEVTAAELCNGFFTQVIEGEGKIVKRSKQYKVGDVKHYSSECVAIEASAGCGLEFTVTHAVKLTLSLQSTSSSNKSIFVLQKNDVSVAASNATDLTENETANHYVITGAKVTVEYELEAGTYEMLYLNEKAAASDSATVNRGGRFFAITTEEIEITPVVQKYSVTYVSTYGIKPADFVDATELTANDLPTLEDANYDFGGWYTDEACTTAAVAGELTANVTLYAKWTIKATVQTVDVTFVFDNGTENNVVAVAEGAKVTKPTDPTKTGYAFDGWFLENATEPFDFDTAINEATTLTARYHQVFTITFENAQGDSPEAITNVTKITVADLPTLSKDYYVFKGWAVSGSTEIITADTDITDNVVLVAQWDAIPTYSLVKDDTEAEVINPNDAKYATIINALDRNYVDPIFQGSNTSGSLGNSTTDNYVTVSGEDGSKIFELKDNSGKATYLCVDTFYSKGVVMAAIDVTFVNQGNGWTFLRVINQSNQEVFGIRVDGGKLKYRLNGSNENLGALSDIASSDKLYNLYLRADLDNGDVLVCVDGKILAQLTIENLTLDHIEFVTSDGNSGGKAKTVNVNGIALLANIEDADFVDNIKARVDKIAAPYKVAVENTDPVEYVYDQTEVTAIITAATEAIDAAQSVQELYGAIGTAFGQFRLLITNEEKAFIKAVADAKTEIGAYLQAASTEMFAVSGYSYTDGTETVTLADYNALEAMLDTELDAATSIDDITNTTTGIIVTFKANIDAISDSSTVMIEYYKDYVKAVLQQTYPASSYTTNATAYATVITALDSDLNSASTKTDIDAAIATADTALSQVAKDSYNLLKANALREYVSEQVETLVLYAKSKYTGSDSETAINAALNTEIGKINAIDEAQESDIDAQLVASKSEMDTVIAGEKAATEITLTFKKFVSDTDSYDSVVVLKDVLVDADDLPNNPSESGLSFVNWCSDDALATDFNFTTSVVSSATTFYAKWYDLGYDFAVSTRVDALEFDSTYVANTEKKSDEELITFKPNSKDDKWNADHNGVRFNGATSSDRYIEINLTGITKPVKINIACNASQAGIYLTLATAKGAGSATQKDNECVLVSNQESLQTITFYVYNEGTYYLNTNNKNIYFNEIIIDSPTEYEATDMVATVTGGTGEISISDVKLVDKDSTEHSLESSAYKVYIDDSTTEATVVNGTISNVTKGNHKVTIKYGRFVEYSVDNIAVATSAVDEDTTLDLTTNNTELYNLIGETEKVQNDSLKYGKYTIDATASNSKFAKNGTEWAQFNVGTQIKFKVEAKTKVTVISKTAGSISINDVTSGTTTVTYYFAEDADVVVKGETNDYIKSITIDVDAEVIDSEVALAFNGTSVTGYDTTNTIVWDIKTDDANEYLTSGSKEGFVVSGSSLGNPSYLEFKNDDKVNFYLVVPTNKKAVLSVNYYNDLSTASATVTVNGRTISGIADSGNGAGNYIYAYNIYESGAIELAASAAQNYLSNLSIRYADLGECTITFDSNEGSNVNDIVVPENTKADKPADPTNGEKVFGGWYLDNGTFAKPFDFTTTNVISNITLYARWYTNYSVTYVANGHGTAPENTTSYQLTAEMLPTLSAEGFTFGGWFTDELLQTAATVGLIDGPVTLYAKWTEGTQLASYSVSATDLTGTLNGQTHDSFTFKDTGSSATITIDAGTIKFGSNGSTSDKHISIALTAGTYTLTINGKSRSSGNAASLEVKIGTSGTAQKLTWASDGSTSDQTCNLTLSTDQTVYIYRVDSKSIGVYSISINQTA